MKKPKKYYPLKKEVEFNTLERLLSVGCTLEEVASWFGVSDVTIESRCKAHYGKRFLDVSKDMANRGKAAIRVSQIKSAVEKESVPMQIHLGKHILGQKDDGDGPGVTKLIIEHIVTEKPEANGSGEGK